MSDKSDHKDRAVFCGSLVELENVGGGVAQGVVVAAGRGPLAKGVVKLACRNLSTFITVLFTSARDLAGELRKRGLRFNY